MIIYRRDDMDQEETPEPQQRLEVLRELVDLLPPDQQLVVSMRFFGAHKTFKQMGDELDLTIYDVQGILNAGLLNLRNMLEGHPVGKVLAAHFGFVA